MFVAIMAALFITACNAHALTDDLGTPWYLTDKNKGIVWSGRYEPSGSIYAQTVSPQSNQYRLPGQYHDHATGLYYNWHRFYDPTIGRYYQADPIGMAGGINRYTYALNNPVSFTDPLGLYSWGQFVGEAGVFAETLGDVLSLSLTVRSREGTLAEDVANFAVGFGDAASFGVTSWIRSADWYGGDCFTNKYSEAYQLGGFAGDTTSAVVPIPITKVSLLAKLHNHHMLPRQFESLFAKAGLNIDDYVKRLPVWMHNLKPFGIHTGSNSWNKQWRVFLESGVTTNRRTILRKMR